MDEFLTNEKKIEDNKYSITLLDRNCHWVVVVLDPVTKGDNVPLYMGVHYINIACMTYLPDTKEHGKARKEQNVMVYNDNSIFAQKKISPDSEILTGYHSGDHNEKENRSGKKCSSAPIGSKKGPSSKSKAQKM